MPHGMTIRIPIMGDHVHNHQHPILRKRACDLQNRLGRLRDVMENQKNRRYID